MCNAHRVIDAEGAPSETLFEQEAFKSLTPSETGAFTIFPQLAENPSFASPAPAPARILQGRKGRNVLASQTRS